MGMVVGLVAGALVADAVATAIGGAVIIGSITVGKVVGAVAGAVVGRVVGSALADEPQRKGPSPTGSVAARNQGQSVSITATDEPIPVAYGFCTNVPALIVYREVAGPNNEFFYLIAVASEGEIEAFDATYLDGTPSTDAKFAGLVTIEYHTGTDAQAASALLLADLPGKWSASDRGAGIAYAVLKLKNDSAAFARGEPAITFDLRGRRIKDTRDGVTRFSPNPALVIRDFWTNTLYGRRIAETRIADAKISAEANYFEGREAVPASAKSFTVSVGIDELAFAEDVPFDNGDGVQLSTTGALPGGTAAATTYYWIRLGARRGQLATSYANAIARTALDITDAGTGSHTCTHVDQARYSANGLLDPSANPYDNLEKLRSSCRAWLFDSSGQYHLVADKPVAGPYDTWDEDLIVGEWSIDLGGEEGRFNRVEARFIDPMKDNQPNIATSDNAAERTADGGKVLLGALRLEFTTNFYMAQRIAQIERRKSRLGLQVSHRVTVKGFKSFVGEVIQHTHSTPGWTAKLYRVMRIAPRFDDELAVDLAEYSADVWTLDAQGAMPIPARTSLPDPSVVGTPSLISVAEELYETTGSVGVRAKAIVRWEPPGGPYPVTYQLEYKAAASAAYKIALLTGATNGEILDIAPGVHDFRVQAINTFGARGGYAQAAKEILGLLAPPAGVQEFAISSLAGGRAELTWTRHADLDVRIGGQILVRWSPSIAAPGWNDAVQVASVPGDARGAQVAHLTGTYLAKARDSSGNESATAVAVVTTEPDLAGFNAVATLTAQPSWSGTRTNVVVRNGTLQLGAVTLIDSMTTPIDSWGLIDSLGGIDPEGDIQFSQVIDLGAVHTSRVTARLETASFNTSDTIDTWLEPIDNWGLIDGAQISDTSCEVFIATTNDDPAGAPAWSAWLPFVVGEYKARGLKFKVRLRSGNAEHNIQVKSLAIAVDMPDREDGARNVASGAATKSVAYTLSPAFKAAPRLAITAKNMGTGDYFAIASETTSGFNITFRNAAGAAVDRTFDWRAISY